MADQMFSLYCGESEFIFEDDFHKLCQELFLSTDNIKRRDTDNVFRHFNKKQDGKMTTDEFATCWKEFIFPVQNPKVALLVVDVQNDFISGTLALKNTPGKQDGAEVVPIINKLVGRDTFDIVVYTKDWHPENHVSFFENVHLRRIDPSSKVTADVAKMCDQVVFDIGGRKVEQTLWPAHCIQNSKGAQFHEDLKIASVHAFVEKGTNPDVDSYSAFFDNERLSQTRMQGILKDYKITDVFICGLALDICVKFTAIDAQDLGFGTFILEDACRSISNEGAVESKEVLTCKECVVLQTNEIDEYLKRKVRHPDFVFRTYSPTSCAGVMGHK